MYPSVSLIFSPLRPRGDAWRVSPTCVGVSETRVWCAKTAVPFEMPFKMQTCVAQRNREGLLDGSRSPRERTLLRSISQHLDMLTLRGPVVMFNLNSHNFFCINVKMKLRQI